MGYRISVDEPSKLEEKLEKMFSSPYGTVELEVGLLNYQILQFHVGEPLEQQRFDVLSVDETLGKHVPFTELISLLTEDVHRKTHLK